MSDIVRDMPDFLSLAAEWNALAASFKTPLLRHEWFAACAEAFCPPDRLAIVLTRRAGVISAIAPLVMTEHRGIAQLRLLAAPTTEPGGLLYRDRQSLTELIEAIMDMRRPAVLARLESRSPEVDMLRTVSRRRGFAIERDPGGSPWLPISSGWAEYEKTISPARRGSFRRAHKRASALGEVTFEISQPAVGDVARLLAEFVRVEAASWKGRSGGALACSPRLHRFFTLYSAHAARLGIFRVGLMRIGDAAAAALLGVQYAGRFWVLKIGYDERYSNCSPGVLLMHEVIRHAFDERLEGFEFLGHDEPWIHAWTDEVHQYTLTRTYPRSLAGFATLGLDACASGMRRLARSTPPPLPEKT